MKGNELLASMPAQLPGLLEICACGHSPDDHPSRGACRHVNRGRKFPAPAACACTRFAPDPRLTDGEVFARRVLQKVLAKEQIPMELVELQDAIQVLAIALWKTAQKYDSRSHVRFRVYAYLELYNDAIDHFRAERGRHGQHRVYDPRNGHADIDNAGVGDGAAGADRLDGVPSRDPADDSDGWASDGGGLLAAGDGGEAWVAGEPRQRGGRRDPRRDARAVRADARRSGAEGGSARREPPEDLKGAARPRRGRT